MIGAGGGGAQQQKNYVLGDRNALDELLSGRTDLFMEQELELFEAIAQQAGFGCVETRNKYVGKLYLFVVFKNDFVYFLQLRD